MKKNIYGIILLFIITMSISAKVEIEATKHIQKIVFGPTQILRPLSWFDTFDLKDPTGQTDGVESFRLRWFPSNNIAIWSWLINNDVDTLSFGGRTEVTSSFGEFGFTYHQDPSKSMQLIGQTSIPVFDSQNRIAFDYRFDGFIGFWNESAIIQSKTSQIILSTFGADYTLPISNGLLIMAETMYTSNKNNNQDEIVTKFIDLLFGSIISSTKSKILINCLKYWKKGLLKGDWNSSKV